MTTTKLSILAQIIRLNNEGSVLVEAKTFSDTQKAIRRFQRALVVSNELANFANDTESSNASGASPDIEHLCDFSAVDALCTEDSDHGLYFFNKSIQVKPTAFQGPDWVEEGIRISISTVITNMALACYQQCQQYSAMRQYPQIRLKMSELLQKSLRLYERVFALCLIQAQRTSPSRSLVFLALCSKNNALWLYLTHGLVEQARQANKDLAWLLQTGTATTTTHEVIVQEMFLNHTVLTWTEYFGACPAVAA